MTNEKTLEILKEMKEDSKAKELFEGMEKTKSPDEAISAYAQVAEKLGYGITAEEIEEAIEQEETRRKAETEKVAADIVALEDEDLEHVAGGERVECEKPYEKIYDKVEEIKEICWRNDICNYVINDVCNSMVI